VKGGD